MLLHCYFIGFSKCEHDTAQSSTMLCPMSPSIHIVTLTNTGDDRRIEIATSCRSIGLQDKRSPGITRSPTEASTVRIFRATGYVWERKVDFYNVHVLNYSGVTQVLGAAKSRP